MGLGVFRRGGLSVALALWPAVVAAASEPAPADECAEGCGRLIGRIRAAGERRPVAQARVLVVPAAPGSRAGPLPRPLEIEEEPPWTRQAVANDEGRYVVENIPVGLVLVIVLAEDFERYDEIARVGRDGTVKVDPFIEPSDETSYKTVVKASEKPPESPTERILTPEEIRTLPGTQGDPLRALQNLPGVARSPASLGLLVLRGAAPGLSRVYFGGHAIPRVFHVLSLASVFPTEVIEQLDFVPGNFDARYGNATGGVVLVEPRRGRRDGFHGYGEIDLAAAGALVEGPLGKGSFIVGAQRGYIDGVVAAADAAVENVTGEPQGFLRPAYYDYQAVVDQPLRTGAEVGVRLFGSGDRLRSGRSSFEDSSFEFRGDFHRIDFVFRQTRSRWTAKLIPSFRFEVSRFSGSAGIRARRRRDFVFGNRAEFEGKISRRFSLLVGTDFEATAFTALDESEVDFVDGAGQMTQSETFRGSESAIGVFTTGNVKLGIVTLRPGVRLNAFSADSQYAFAVDPRGTAHVDPTDRLRISVGLGRYSQVRSLRDNETFDFVGQGSTLGDGSLFVPPVFNRFNPEITFAPLDVDLGVRTATHASVGSRYRFDKGWSIEGTGFLREQDNDTPVNFEGQVVPFSTREYSAGLELLIRKRLTKKLYGWIAYTLMWSRLRFLEDNGEIDRTERPSDFDQRHNLILLASYELPKRWRIGGRFRFVTGYPFTPVIGSVAFNDGFGAVLGRRNSARLAPFHQLGPARRQALDPAARDLYRVRGRAKRLQPPEPRGDRLQPGFPRRDRRCRGAHISVARVPDRLLTVSMALAAGVIFAGDYRVVRPIGSGGMGHVYQVEQLSTRKHRALKVLTNSLGDDERARSRFIREATVGADIRSEHIVDVIAAGVDPGSGTPWLAMELLDGLDLRRVVEHRRRLGPAQTLAVFRQIGHGLAAAHGAGIVHRDLKPENLFVARSRRAGESFTIKILDFGIAKLTRESIASTDTATVGSPMWMAPEQINAAPVSPRTDVWALGLLVFWALTGRVYWRAAHAPRVTVQSLFAEQLFAPIVPASARAGEFDREGDIPPDFDAWFEGCVVRDPTARFVDARAAMNALRSILEPLADDDPRRDEAMLPERNEDWTLPERSRPRLQKDSGPADLEGTTGVVLGRSDFAPTVGATQQSAPHPVVPDQAKPPPRRPTTQLSTAERQPKSRRNLAYLIAIPAAVGGALGAFALTYEPDDAPPEDPEPVPLESKEPDPLPPIDPEPPQPPPEPHVRTVPTGPVSFLGWAGDGVHFALQTGDAQAVFTGLAGDPVDDVAASSLSLLGPEARRAPFQAEGEVVVTVEDLPLGTKARLLPKRTGFDVTWYGVETQGSGMKTSPPGPRLHVEFDDGSFRYDMLAIRIPFDYDEVAALGAPSIDGRLRFYWSPDGDRCVVLLAASPSGDDTEARHAWYLRAAAPQIRLLDAGAGQATVEAVAEKLGAAGLPVALVGRAAESRRSSVVQLHHDDARGREIVDYVNKALASPLPTQLRPHRDMLVATIVLGTEAQGG